MLRSIKIDNWKGHDSFSLSFNDGVNFVVGPNGSGKTSVLDAICFALLGDISATPVYKRIDFQDLIRDPNQDLDISLVLEKESVGEIIIQRRKPSSGNRQSTLQVDGNYMARGWSKVTSEITKVLQTDELILKSVILLSEGDTFLYSTSPPGEGLTRHIETVLGIDRLESLRNHLMKAKKAFIDNAKDAIDASKEVREIDEEGNKQLESLIAHLDNLKSEREDFLAEKERIRKEISELQTKIDNLNSYSERASEIRDEWKSKFPNIQFEEDTLQLIKNTRANLETKRNSQSEERDKLRDRMSFLKSQQESQIKILSLLDPISSETDEPDCPICKRPLTEPMVIEIRDECNLKLSELNKTKTDLDTEIPDIEVAISNTDNQIENLIEIDADAGSLLELQPEAFLPKIMESLLKIEVDRRTSCELEKDTLVGNIEELEEKIRETEVNKSKLEDRISEIDRKSISSRMVAARKGEFLSSIFLEAIIDALGEQRNQLLGPMVHELSAVSSSFLRRDVEVHLNSDAQLVITDKASDEMLLYPQLSGGEKTALLIFTQVLLCKHFSNAEFMLLDEPLEHLDSRNRWALIRFLVDTVSLGFPKQLVVTTVEESLLREYLHYDMVSICRLS